MESSKWFISKIAFSGIESLITQGKKSYITSKVSSLHLTLKSPILESAILCLCNFFRFFFLSSLSQIWWKMFGQISLPKCSSDQGLACWLGHNFWHFISRYTSKGSILECPIKLAKKEKNIRFAKTRRKVDLFLGFFVSNPLKQFLPPPSPQKMAYWSH